MSLVDEQRRAARRAHFVIYNPPVVNRALGIRRRRYAETRDVALAFLKRERADDRLRALAGCRPRCC